jgi:hypothetical protein
MRRVVAAAKAEMRAMPDEQTGRVANIDARGRRRRLISGVGWLAVAVVATVTLTALRGRDLWYALLVVPFTLAALGYFQARERT